MYSVCSVCRRSFAFLFMLMNNGLFVLLCGGWFTLHFPWIYSAESFVVCVKIEECVTENKYVCVFVRVIVILY